VRTVFFGTPELAVPSVAALHAAGHEIAAVVTQPDRAQGRSKTPVAPPVKAWAEAHGVAVCQPERLNDGTFEAWLRAQAPEVCTVAAYGRLLKQPILDIPPLGWLNVHPSLLPRWRGPSPIQTAILSGDAETGVSIMRMILEMDAGAVVSQERTAIGPEETAGQLSDRLAALGARMLVAAVARLAAEGLAETPQDPALVTHCRLFRKEDGALDWRRPAEELARLVRAAHPWPVAFTTLGDAPLRVHRAAVRAEAAGAAPGEVIAADGSGLWVATGSGALGLLEVQAPGKRALPAGDFLRGRAVQPGTRLGATATEN
jgi:methionyl-tRNA formyltransferase